MGDRGGGRESKKGSLRKSTKNPGCAAGKAKSQKKTEDVVLGASLPCPRPGSGAYVDCGCAILSRQFDRDRDRVLSRSRQDGVCVVVCWCPSIDKLDELAALACDIEHSGSVYFMAGVHPDNVDRTNQKSHEDWVKRAEVAARRPECCAILSGLNLSREHATHFAQEALLKSSCSLAARVQLPLILHVAPDTGSDVNSLERTLEILHEVGWAGAEREEGTTVILHDAVSATAGLAHRMQAVVDAGLLCSVSAAGLQDSTQRAQAEEALRVIPPHQLLVCSDAPWHTPQNHPDSYVRSQVLVPAQGSCERAHA